MGGREAFFSDSLGRAISRQDLSLGGEHSQVVQQLLISVTVLSSDPSTLWVLLLCVHIIFHSARATPIPQATTAATASAGVAKDSCPTWPLMLPAAKRCPALEVTWPEVEIPLSKERFCWKPRRAQWWEGRLWAQRVQGWD